MDLPGVPSEKVEDFVRQLDLIVFERGGLWEPLMVSTVVLADRSETHGPWPFQACSVVLTSWLEAGLINLYRVAPEENDLSVTEARAVLRDESAWRAELAVHLAPTSKGEAASPDDWRRALELGGA